MLADVPRRVTWRAIIAMIRHSGRGSALRREFDPSVDHTIEAEMLRRIDLDIRLLHWAQTKQAKAGTNQPEMVRFAWEPKSKSRSAFDPDVMPIDEMRKRIGW